MKPEDFSIEDKKYSDLWLNGYKEARYQKLLKQMVLIYPDKNIPIIDFGCGNGKTLNSMRALGYLNTVGVDISSASVQKLKKEGFNVFHTSLDALTMFPSNKFQIGFCNDVLEHIEEKYLDNTLKEMCRVCTKSIFLSVSPKHSHHKSLEGEELHLTVRNKSWWESFLKNYGNLTRCEPIWQRPFNASLRYRLDLNK